MAPQILDRDEIKNIEMRILKEIDLLCNTHSLKYVLFYGSLLGAIRHKGFIPWDDDVDIILPREDYNKLISIIKTSNSTPHWLEILDSDKDGYYYPFAKAVDNRTVAKMESNTTEHGVWIDIFPIDYVPPKTFISHRCIDLCYFLRETTISMTTDFSSSRIENTQKKRLYFFHWLGNTIGKKRICSFFTRIQLLISKKSSGYYANLFPTYKYKEIYKSNDMFEQIDLQFDNTTVKGPKNYDLLLKQLYGDYRTLPPVEKRRTHGITAWYK